MLGLIACRWRMRGASRNRNVKYVSFTVTIILLKQTATIRHLAYSIKLMKIFVLILQSFLHVAHILDTLHSASIRVTNVGHAIPNNTIYIYTDFIYELYILCTTLFQPHFHNEIHIKSTTSSQLAPQNLFSTMIFCVVYEKGEKRAEEHFHSHYIYIFWYAIYIPLQCKYK